MSPICMSCLREMEPKRNEVPILSGSTVWYGDLWECQRCGQEIITGFGNGLEGHWNDEAIDVRMRS